MILERVVDLLTTLNWSNVALLPLGIMTGLLAAILGIGGGLLMVPALTYWGAVPVQATATSLLAIVIGSASGTSHNWRAGQLRTDHVLILAIPAMLSSTIGVAIANQLPAQGLLLSFAGLQIVAIFLIDLKRRLKRKQHVTETSAVAVPTESLSWEQVNGSGASGSSPLPRSSLLQGGGIGVLAGVLSGLFGVGGGVVMVPLQMLFLGEQIKEAVRTSLGAVCLIAIAGITQHARSGNVLWLQGLLLGFGTLAGAQIGARLLIQLPERWVRQLFRALLAFMASYMVYKAWSV